jgi:hypothetical protein
VADSSWFTLDNLELGLAGLADAVSLGNFKIAARVWADQTAASTGGDADQLFDQVQDVSSNVLVGAAGQTADQVMQSAANTADAVTSWVPYVFAAGCLALGGFIVWKVLK